MAPPVETLDVAQIEAALQWLQQKLGHFSAELKEEWTLSLAHLYPGELAPVVDRWIDNPPSPVAVLDYIRTNRPAPIERPEPIEPIRKNGHKLNIDDVPEIQRAREKLAQTA